MSNPDIIAEAARAARTNRVLSEATYEGWRVRLLFGVQPGPTEGVDEVAFMASATTADMRRSRPPALTGLDQTLLVEVGHTGSLWMSAGTRPELTKKIKKALPGFRWSAQEAT